MGSPYKYDSSWKTDEPKEVLNHADLKDMPDTGGVNEDHDVRYQKKLIYDTDYKCLTT